MRRLLLSLAIILVGLSMLLPFVPANAGAQAALPTCFGQEATIVGTSGDDLLEGTDEPDVIVGLGGRDTIRGLGGDDLICGDAGRDRLDGGAGNDQIFGGSTRDILLGGAGDDALWGGRGRDLLRGGAGFDVLNGEVGNDRCVGGPGIDQAGRSCERVEVEASTQVFDVGGAEVWAAAPATGLPDRAQRVLFQRTILDAGGGPKLCVGGILSSYPPQCGEYFLTNFEMEGDWFEEASGVRWGFRRVVVNWPPKDRSLVVKSEGAAIAAGPDGFVRPNFKRPSHCAELIADTSTTQSTIQQWAKENRDIFAGIWVSGRGASEIIVLQVKGNAGVVEHVTSALATADRTPCVVSVDFSLDELAAVRKQLNGVFRLDVGVTGYGQGRDDVRVEVAVADRATVESIVGLVSDRPDLLRIVAAGTTLR